MRLHLDYSFGNSEDSDYSFQQKWGRSQMLDLLPGNANEAFSLSYVEYILPEAYFY
jgi:hypothetical protein